MAITKYKVTTELYTSRWTKFLRFFRLKPARHECTLDFPSAEFKVGDILNVGEGEKVVILEILE